MDSALRLKFAKRAFWGYIALTSILIPFLPTDTDEYGPLKFMVSLLGSLCIFLCLLYDSKVVSRKLGPLFKIGIIFLAIVFVPIYIYQTRGFKKGTLALAKHCFIVFGIIIALSIVFAELELLGYVALPA
jgi:hypothetical protein